MRPLRPSRGNVAILTALLLPLLLGFVALCVDFGHFWMVQGELQNAADAAALAGARDLNGTAPQLLPARLSANAIGALHEANQSTVSLDMNAANDPAGDIVLGQWNFTAHTFTPAVLATPLTQINAVKVVARRTAAEGGAVATFFGGLLGKSEQDITATAIAAGGGPASTCAAPIALADCDVFAADGTLRCDQSLTFGQATTDTAGFTLLNSSNPTTPTITCLFARTLGSPCPGNCDCSTPCNSSSVSGGNIALSNGNNISKTAVDDINAAVASAGASGLFVQVPVFVTGLTQATCSTYNFNHPAAIAGFVELRLTGATFSPNKTITASIDCTRSGAWVPGSSLLGYRSTKIYLVQ